MSPYLFLRGLLWPALLVTFGVTALLDQWHLLPFHRSWPLYVIVFGLLRLAQVLALTVWPPPSPGTGSFPIGAAAPWTPAAPWTAGTASATAPPYVPADAVEVTPSAHGKDDRESGWEERS